MIDLSIKTKRLTLRPFTVADASRVRELAGEWDIAAMTASVPHPYPEGAAEQWIKLHTKRRGRGQSYNFAIDLDGQLTGSIGLELDSREGFELGYWLGKPFWGQGLVSEAAEAMVEFAFDWARLTHLIAGYFLGNPASGRILAKLGFQITHTETHYHRVRGYEIEVARLSLTQDDWRANRV